MQTELTVLTKIRKFPCTALPFASNMHTQQPFWFRYHRLFMLKVYPLYLHHDGLLNIAQAYHCILHPRYLYDIRSMQYTPILGLSYVWSDTGHRLICPHNRILASSAYLSGSLCPDKRVSQASQLNGECTCANSDKCYSRLRFDYCSHSTYSFEPINASISHHRIDSILPEPQSGTLDLLRRALDATSTGMIGQCTPLPIQHRKR